MKKRKTKRKLSAYNKFVKMKHAQGIKSFKKIAVLWRRKKGTASSKTSRSKTRSRSYNPSIIKRKRRRFNMAKRRRKTKRKSWRRRISGRKILGVNLGDLFWMSAGAGTSGAVGGLITQYAPQIPNNIAELVYGISLILIGKKINPAIGKMGMGALSKVIGDFIEVTVTPMLTGMIPQKKKSIAAGVLI